MQLIGETLKGRGGHQQILKEEMQHDKEQDSSRSAAERF